MGDTPIRVSRSTSEESLLSVVLVGRRSLATQRRNRYVAGSTAHPGRMAPDLATALIDDYTQPGDLILDPFAGTGTTLVEAVHLGRNAVGVDIDVGWTAVARANLTLAGRQRATGRGRVVRGDATRLPAGLPAELRGQVKLVLTGPPHGRTMRRATGAGGSRVPLIDGVAAVLKGCVPLLAPTGVIVVVTRPSRHHGRRVDHTGQVTAAAATVGLELVDSRRAVHAVVRDDRFVARHMPRRSACVNDGRATFVSQILHDDLTILTSRSVP